MVPLNFFWRFSRRKHGIYKLSRAGISKGCNIEGSVEQSIVFTVISMHGVYKLSRAGISKGFDSEGSVEQSMVFTVFSRGRHGVYKLSRAGISKRCDFECSVEQSRVFTVFSMVFTSWVGLAFRRDAILKPQSSKAWYLLCLAKESMILQTQPSWHFEGMRFWRLSQAKHGIYCV